MKTFLTLFVLLFSSSVVAEDISDFQIEGMSIGDSLLDYFSEKKIRNNKKSSPISVSHVISSTKLIHALYSSEENKKWVHLQDMPVSKRLGK